MPFMLSVTFVECRKQTHYPKCRYAECRYASCRYAECRGASLTFADKPGLLK